MLKYLTLILLTVISFVVGFYTYSDFLMWTLPKIKGFQFTVNTFAGQFNGLIGFSMTLALIPVSVALLWKFTPLFNVKRRIISVLIIITSISLFAFIRQQWIATEASHYQQLGSQTIGGIQFQTSMPLENLNITTYMFFGLIAGILISYFLLRELNYIKQQVQ